ncbi:leucine-rich repeat extensin-like protein 3 [Populus alba x Populus x berolinensis]|nr:leucine-rich repeat extensin-like protein 3 [Populus alba x Populus x berolinensis]
MSAPMAPIIVHALLATLFALPLSLIAHPANNPTSRIIIVGVVYCDTCSTNTFSRYSCFLPGADVHIQCIFQAISPKTTEKIMFSANRTTDRYGIYKVTVPEVDGVDCAEGSTIELVCQASLIRSSYPACNVPGLKTSTDEISVKSKHNNLCIYSMNALTYRPSKKNATLCGKHKEELQISFNSSKFFLPDSPPYGFPWHTLPNMSPSPFPPLPPSPSPSFPPLPPPSQPSPPLPSPRPPSLPFPFPPLPPTPSLFHPAPPPAFNLGNPRTWIPNAPSLAPPPPPEFNLRDPRTWIPYIPPSPPNNPQNQNP